MSLNQIATERPRETLVPYRDIVIDDRFIVDALIDRVKDQVPVGARDAQIVAITDDFAHDGYRVRFQYRFPFGQLSFGL